MQYGLPANRRGFCKAGIFATARIEQITRTFLRGDHARTKKIL